MQDLDNPDTTLNRIEILKKKKYLKSLYSDFYNIFKYESKGLSKGKKLELGSGAGFLKKVIKDVITSDVMVLPNCDMVIKAEKIPFRDNSLSAIFLLNVFHHIKNPKKALTEFQRSLKKGGRVIMIEPYNSFWSRFIYINFHHELFDPDANWNIKSKGNLSGANDALPWIIFERDKDKFHKLLPNLRIKKIIPHTPFSYIISGGFTLPSFLPPYFYPLVKWFEKRISFLNNFVGMFVTIVLEK